MKARTLILLSALLFICAPGEITAQASSDAKALPCVEACGRITDPNGDVIAHFCTTVPNNSGGESCFATATGCSVVTFRCDWVEVFNSNGEPAWSGRLCDPIKPELRLSLEGPVDPRRPEPVGASVLLSS